MTDYGTFWNMPPFRNPIDNVRQSLWNGIFIHPDINYVAPLSSLDDLRPHVDNCMVNVTNDGRVTQQDFRDLLRCDEGIIVANVYDRDPTQFDWYYTLYAAPQDQCQDLPINSVASIALKAGEEPIRGPVLVMKNGPEAGYWDIDDTISDEEFARTLWWYLMSGNGVEHVFGMRTLCRLLADGPD